MKRVGVLVSGRGSNLQALIDRFHGVDGAPVSIAVVISNVATAAALDRARQAGIPAVVVAHGDFSTREAFDQQLVAALRKHHVDLVCLAGFMRILTSAFLNEFPQRVVNVHPALLPSFPGAHGIRDALAHGVKVAGCTVHLVDGGVDTGPILAQAAIDVADDDTEESLASRIHLLEHRLLTQAIADLATDRVSFVGRRALTGAAVPRGASRG